MLILFCNYLNIDAFKDRLFQIIYLFESHEIQVAAISCDLGPLNKALLKLLGISEKYTLGATNILNIPDYAIVNSFKNPYRYDDEIQVFLDCTHIFKRWRGQFERTDLIIHDDVRARWIKEYNLSPVDKLCSFHWIRMLYHREEYEREKNGAALTLTKLSHDDIWPRGFQRMRVKYSSKIFSEKVSSALIAHK